jgi:hypothetical protein
LIDQFFILCVRLQPPSTPRNSPCVPPPSLIMTVSHATPARNPRNSLMTPLPEQSPWLVSLRLHFVLMHVDPNIQPDHLAFAAPSPAHPQGSASNAGLCIPGNASLGRSSVRAQTIGTLCCLPTLCSSMPPACPRVGAVSCMPEHRCVSLSATRVAQPSCSSKRAPTLSKVSFTPNRGSAIMDQPTRSPHDPIRCATSSLSNQSSIFHPSYRSPSAFDRHLLHPLHSAIPFTLGNTLLCLSLHGLGLGYVHVQCTIRLMAFSLICICISPAYCTP